MCMYIYIYPYMSITYSIIHDYVHCISESMTFSAWYPLRPGTLSAEDPKGRGVHDADKRMARRWHVACPSMQLVSMSRWPRLGTTLAFLLTWRHCLRNSTIPSDIYHKVIARLRGQGFQAHVVTALPRLCRPLPIQREHEVFTHRIWVLDFKKNISNDSYLKHMPFNGGERACTYAPLICSLASSIRVIHRLVFLECRHLSSHVYNYMLDIYSTVQHDMQYQILNANGMCI